MKAFELPKVERLPHAARRDTRTPLRGVLRFPEDPKVPARLLLACVLGCMATALCYLLLVHTSVGQRMDDAAYYGAVRAGSQHSGFIDTQLRRMDERSLKVTMVAMFGIGLLRRRPILGIGGALVVGAPVAATHVLRYHVLDRSPFAVVSAIGNTFPSGHAAGAAGCAMALVLVSPPRTRGIAAILGGVFAAAVAAQVQVIGWHRPSDSIGACLLAFACASGVAGVLAWTRPGRAQKRRRQWGAFGVMVAASTVAITLGALSAAQGIGLSGGTASPAVQHQAYVAGLEVTISVVALLMAALLLLIGDADFDDGWRKAIAAARDLLLQRRREAQPLVRKRDPKEVGGRRSSPSGGDVGASELQLDGA